MTETKETAERKEKFTPGPWSCTNVYHPQGIPSGHVFSEIVNVAIVGDYPNKEIAKYNKERWDADKNLIAAAPDMYAALENAVKDYGKPGGPWNVPSEPGTWIHSATSALAKARGES